MAIQWSLRAVTRNIPHYVPVDYSPVKLIVVKFKINLKSDVQDTFWQHIHWKYRWLHLTYFDTLIIGITPFSSCRDVNESLGKCRISLSVTRKNFGILAWSDRLHNDVPGAKYSYRTILICYFDILPSKEDSCNVFLLNGLKHAGTNTSTSFVSSSLLNQRL